VAIDLNTKLYSAGLLDTLLKHAENSCDISDYLQCETQYLEEHIKPNESVADFGCGYGRHLQILESRIHLGLGIDLSDKHIQDAIKQNQSKKLNFIVGDIQNITLDDTFTTAICMYNTLGNVDDVVSVVSSMKRCLLRDGKVIVSVFSEKSIQQRIEMYTSMGLTNARVEENLIVTDEGFWSCHFTKDEVKHLLPDCTISDCSETSIIACWIKST